MPTPGDVATLALPPTVKRPVLQIGIPALLVLGAAAIAFAAVPKADLKPPIDGSANVEARLAALEAASRQPPIITDWKAYAPTVTADSMTIANGSIEGFYRRVGDTAEVQIDTRFTQVPRDDRGARATGRLVWTLPMGLVFDDRKGVRSLRGVAAISAGVGDEHLCEAAITAAGAGIQVVCESAGATGRTAHLTTAWPRPITDNAPVGVVLQLRFPVEGWTSTTR